MPGLQPAFRSLYERSLDAARGARLSVRREYGADRPTRFLGASETRSSLTRIRSASILRDRFKSQLRALGPRNGQLTGTGGRASGIFVGFATRRLAPDVPARLYEHHAAGHPLCDPHAAQVAGRQRDRRHVPRARHRNQHHREDRAPSAARSKVAAPVASLGGTRPILDRVGSATEERASTQVRE